MSCEYSTRRLKRTHTETRALDTEAKEITESNEIEQAEVDRLRSMIVRSPQKLRSRIADLSERLATARSDVNEATKRLRHVQSRIALLDKLAGVSLAHFANISVRKEPVMSVRMWSLRDALQVGWGLSWVGEVGL